MPLLSVIVTVHNREQYLRETLASVLGAAFEDFELIIVDDASSDRSLQIAKRIAESDSRIQVHTNACNLGDYPNRIRAACLAQGRYVKFVDSDDLIYSHSLAIMAESMERCPEAAVGLAHSAPEDGSPYPWLLSPEEAYRKHFLGRGCLSCGPTGAIIRRDAFEAVGGFRPEWGVLSDIDLWYRLAARWPTVLLPPGLVWWRRHTGQEFTKTGADLVYLQRGYDLTTQALSDPACPLPYVEVKSALRRARQHYSRRLLSMAFRQHRPRAAYRLFSGSDLGFADLMSGFSRYR